MTCVRVRRDSRTGRSSRRRSSTLRSGSSPRSEGATRLLASAAANASRLDSFEKSVSGSFLNSGSTAAGPPRGENLPESRQSDRRSPGTRGSTRASQEERNRCLQASEGMTGRSEGDSDEDGRRTEGGRPESSARSARSSTSAWAEPSLEPLHRRIAAEIPIERGRLLDIGCGPGNLDRLLAAGRPIWRSSVSTIPRP